MFSKLTLSFCLLMTGVFSFASPSDPTIDSLTSLQIKIKILATSMLDLKKSNSERLQLLTPAKENLELEMKRILQAEKREISTSALHDQLYDRADDQMIGLTAISLLKLNEDQMTVKDTSCEEARSLLRIFARNEVKFGMGPDHSIFHQAIELMCRR